MPLGDERVSSGSQMLQQTAPLSEPVNIPASPLRRSPSRQSSRDSLDEGKEED